MVWTWHALNIVFSTPCRRTGNCFHLGITNSAAHSGIILCICPANERWRYIVMSPLIGWAHTQNDPCTFVVTLTSICSNFDVNNGKPHQGVPLSTWLTDWGRVTHICVSNLTIIGSDNGLSPGRCQAIIWTSAEILLTGPLGTNFSETLIEIQTSLFKQMYFKQMLSAKWHSFCLGLNVLTYCGLVTPYGNIDLNQNWLW